MAVVNARDLAGTIPRYRHGIAAGSRVYLAGVGRSKAEVSSTVKGGDSVGQSRRGCRTHWRVLDGGVRGTSKGLEPGIIGRLSKLERVWAVQIRVGVSLGQRRRRDQ